MTESSYTIEDGMIKTESGHKFDFVQLAGKDGRTLTAYNNWFGRDALPLWQKEGVFDAVPVVNSYLEIGVNCGVSFNWIIENVLSDHGEAIGIDPFSHKRPRVNAGLKLAYELFGVNLKPHDDKFRLFKEPSQVALSRMALALFEADARGAERYSFDFDLIQSFGKQEACDSTACHNIHALETFHQLGHTTLRHGSAG